MCGILTTPASDDHERLKTNGTATKNAKETINKTYTVKHIQRQQFSFTKKSIKVSLKILVYVLSRLPGVCFFQR